MRRTIFCFGLALAAQASAGDGDDLLWFGHARIDLAHADADSRLDAGERRLHAGIEAQLAALWEPGIDWRLFAQAVLRSDWRDAGNTAGLVEAHLDRDFYLRNDQRLRVRVGQFFLPTSREAVDAMWQSPYTPTLSALNSWIAEEFRPIGVDLSWHSRADAERSFEAALTAFGGNDSAGTLLAWRGFAWHDRIGVFGEVLPLPALPSLVDGAEFGHQRNDGTRPFGSDLDGRVGWSLRASYGPPERLRGFASAVDTRGDRGLHRGEYAWRTRFALLGLEWQPAPRWSIAGEWLRGDSGMGFAPGPRVQIDFRAAYLLASFAPDERWRFSARVEGFAIDDRDGVVEDNDDRGHALTLAALRQFGEHWRAAVELIRAEGRHAAAPLLGEAIDDGGTQWRMELRRSF